MSRICKVSTLEVIGARELGLAARLTATRTGEREDSTAAAATIEEGTPSERADSPDGNEALEDESDAARALSSTPSIVGLLSSTGHKLAG